MPFKKVYNSKKAQYQPSAIACNESIKEAVSVSAQSRRKQSEQSTIKSHSIHKQLSQEQAATSSETISQQEHSQYVFFWKPYAVNGWCCQWYQCDMIDDTGQTWNCCEQYYMWHKAAAFSDTDIMTKIHEEKDPIKQKALGKQVKAFDEEKWNSIKYDVILRANRLKFSQCHARSDDTIVFPPDAQQDSRARVPLKRLLLATGSRILAEASPFDRLCGIGFRAEDALSVPREQWGENLLGRALMEIRAELHSDDHYTKEEKTDC